MVKQGRSAGKVQLLSQNSMIYHSFYKKKDKIRE